MRRGRPPSARARHARSGADRSSARSVAVPLSTLRAQRAAVVGTGVDGPDDANSPCVASTGTSASGANLASPASAANTPRAGGELATSSAARIEHGDERVVGVGLQREQRERVGRPTRTPARRRASVRGCAARAGRSARARAGRRRSRRRARPAGRPTSRSSRTPARTARRTRRRPGRRCRRVRCPAASSRIAPCRGRSCPRRSRPRSRRRSR